MPGVTMTHSGPIASRSGLISWADATQPSRPASRVTPARCSTWASTLDGTPTSRWSVVRSRLVSTVTPRQLGRGAHHRQAAARVKVQHEDTVTRGLVHGGAYRVRDVVVLQIEEDAEAAL